MSVAPVDLPLARAGRKIRQREDDMLSFGLVAVAAGIVARFAVSRGGGTGRGRAVRVPVRVQARTPRTPVR
ncbi:hypothetical protein GCM10011345_19500 [Gemmobacter megaterium]|nr:hypothetical protein GCM10011345_19500 [Gemmobacter megaterium]